MHTTQVATLRNMPKLQLVHDVLFPAKQVEQLAPHGTHAPDTRVYPGMHSVQLLKLIEQFKQNESEQFEQ